MYPFCTFLSQSLDYQYNPLFVSKSKGCYCIANEIVHEKVSRCYLLVGTNRTQHLKQIRLFYEDYHLSLWIIQ